MHGQLKSDTIKACLFDLDGTLVDSMWMWGSIDVEYLNRFGLGCPPLLQKRIEGMSFSETAQYFKKTFNIPDSIEKIKADWEEMSLSKYQNEVRLKSGVADFLSLLKSCNIRMGIASSNGRKMVDAVLNALNITDYFDAVVTACEVDSGKPAPDIYLHVANLLRVCAEDCLVFEDIPAGITAGKRAGMQVCAVEDDYSKSMRAEKETASDCFIESFYELMPVFEKRKSLS